MPLASLDLSPPDNELPQTRFVESHVKILDLECRLGSAPSVVIARNDPKGTAYALERQQNGLYVMCKLGPWVELGDLARRATALCHERLAPPRSDRRETDSNVALTTPHLHRDHKKKRAAIEAIQNLVRKKSKSQTIDGCTNRSDDVDVDTQVSQLPSPEIKSDENMDMQDISNAQNVPAACPSVETELPTASQQTADTIFDNIRTHYFEALYRSMVCLPSSYKVSTQFLTIRRAHWRTLLRAHCLEHDPPSIWISNPIWIW